MQWIVSPITNAARVTEVLLQKSDSCGQAMLTVTLDTNVIREWWCDQAKMSVVDQLIELSSNGHLDLAITTRIRADIPHPPLSARIESLPALDIGEIGTAFRLGVSRLGGADTLVGGELWGRFNKLMNEERPTGKKAPDWRDQDHLFGHFKSSRDVFLTWDRGILNMAGSLKDKLGLVVKTPEEFLNSNLQSVQT